MLAVVLPLLIFSAMGISRIGFDDGLRSVFASDSAVFKDYVRNSKMFAHSESDVAILFTAPAKLDTRAMTVLQNFVLDAQFLDGVDAVFSIFSLRKRDPLTGKMVPLFPEDLSNTTALDNALDQANARPGTGAKLISKNQRQAVVILSLGQAISDMKGSSVTLRELRALANKATAGTDFTIGITGILSVRDQIIHGLKSDQIKINILGALIAFVISWLVFRSFWVTVLNTLTPLAALLLCLGAFGWFGLSINALTNALPVLILVLASSDSIHMTYEIRRQIAAGATLVKAVTSSVKDIAAPCALTSLTTIFAFASLFYSDSPIVRDMAIAGGVGVLIALLAVLFVHPLVFILGGQLPFIRKTLAQPAAARTGLVLRPGMFGWVVRRPAVIVGVGIAISLAALALFFPIETSYQFMENIDPDQEVAVVMSKIEQVSGPITSIDISVPISQGHTAFEPKVLAELSRLDARLGTVKGVAAVISMQSLVSQLSLTPGRSVAEQLSEVLKQLPGRFRNRMISDDGRTLQIMLLVRDLGSRAVLAQVDQINRIIKDSKLTLLHPRRPTGFLVMSSTLSSSMIKQLTTSFLIAALICPILIGLWFRRFSFGLAAVVPNILPIAVVGAALTVSGIGIQFTSALALTIAFGIALDDSIHVFNRLALQERDSGMPISKDTIVSSMQHIAPVLITTTLILSAGLIATQISDMPMIRFFGTLCILTFLIALICDLFLLPAIVSWFSSIKRRVKVIA